MLFRFNTCPLLWLFAKYKVKCHIAICDGIKALTSAIILPSFSECCCSLTLSHPNYLTLFTARARQFRIKPTANRARAQLFEARPRQLPAGVEVGTRPIRSGGRKPPRTSKKNRRASGEDHSSPSSLLLMWLFYALSKVCILNACLEIGTNWDKRIL